MRSPRKDLTPPCWVDETTWICRRHLPSAKYSAATEKCACYNCPVERPFPLTEKELVTLAERRAQKDEIPKVTAAGPKPELPTPLVKVTFQGVSIVGTAGEPESPAKFQLPQLPPRSKPLLPSIRADQRGWMRLCDMKDKDLPGETLDSLRKYAAHVLKINRASKILGGKPALLVQIMKRRKGLK